MNHYVYEITNLIDGKKYIGKHSTELDFFEDNYYGSGVLIQKALSKYGRKNFSRRVLRTCSTEEEALNAEKEEIEKVKAYESLAYYNLCEGGQNGVKGSIPSAYKYNNNPLIVFNSKKYIERLEKEFSKVQNSTYSKLEYYIGYHILKGRGKRWITEEAYVMIADCFDRTKSSPLELIDEIYGKMKKKSKEELRQIYQKIMVTIYKSELEVINLLSNVDIPDEIDLMELQKTLISLLIMFKITRNRNNNLAYFEKRLFKTICDIRIKDDKLKTITSILIENGFVYFTANRFKVPFCKHSGDDAFETFCVDADSAMLLDMYKGSAVSKCKRCERLIRGERGMTKKYCNDCLVVVKGRPETRYCEECGEEFWIWKKSRMRICYKCKYAIENKKTKEKEKSLREKNKNKAKKMKKP